MRIFGYRSAALAVAAALGLAACGGESTTEASLEPAASDTAEVEVEDAGSADTAEANASASEDAGSNVEDAGSKVEESESSEADTADAGEAESAPVDPEAAAAANLPLLEPGETVVDHQVLNVADGSISTLGEKVDGDRPVLLWFFSPH